MNNKPPTILEGSNPNFNQSMNAQQRSRWIAYMADGKNMSEEKDDWTIVPKEKIVGLGMVVPRMSIIVPSVGEGFQTFELTNGHGVGTVVDKMGNCMYVEADVAKGAAVFKIGNISEMQVKFYNMADVKTDDGNALAVDLPGNMLLIPAGNKNFKFIQYKDGIREIIGARDKLLGQVIGAIVDKMGNYIYAYHDNIEQAVVIMMNNVFAKSCKLSLSVQGIDKSTLINPFKGQFGEQAKVIAFPKNILLN